MISLSDIYDASPRAFFRFARVSGLAEHREDVPREAWFAAKIAAAMAEDCGPCTQLVVTMAEREGVSPPTLRAILAGEQGALPPDAALGFRLLGLSLSATLREVTVCATRWCRDGAEKDSLLSRSPSRPRVSFPL